jgi:hypothetical protein
MQIMDLTSWTDYKALVSSKALLLQYSDKGDYYDIYAPEDSSFLWHFALPKDGGSDVTDFETNYKPTANAPLEFYVNFKDLGDNTPITAVTIAANKKLKVLDLEVPVGKRWDIHAWDGSGTNNGFFELVEFFGTQTETVRDAMDATTGWAIASGPGTLSLDTVDKHSGTGSLKIDATGTGGSTITLAKTLSPTQNWSADSEISVWAKVSALTNGPKIWLKVTQSATTYTFSSQSLGLNWTEFRFDLSEISTFDKTAVSKIEILVSKTGSREFHFDELSSMSLGDSRQVDQFYSGAISPYDHLFPVPIKIVAGHRLAVFITNKQASTGDFEIGMNGKEVTV